MASRHICPKCGGKIFITGAYVGQDWKVDEDGNCIEVTAECTQVLHYPNDDNVWECENCGAEAVIVE